jgi:hypothetical protein
MVGRIRDAIFAFFSLSFASFLLLLDRLLPTVIKIFKITVSVGDTLLFGADPDLHL